MSEKLRFTLSTLMGFVVIIGGVCAAFFGSQASSKSYTDDQVRSLRTEAFEQDRCFQKDLEEIRVKTAVIEEILVQKYGRPKSNR